jgi:hypothetical protein
MKNCKCILFVGLLSLFVSNTSSEVWAAARSNEGFDYLYRNPSLSRLTAGFYGGNAKREVTLSGSAFETTVSSSRMYGYLGYDITRWINMYAILGANEAELPMQSDADSELLYGAGLAFNLLNHFVREPTPMEDAFRINGDIRFITTQTDSFMQTIRWQEITASLRFSLLNFPTGNKAFRPEAIALYVGPAFSHIQGNVLDATQEFGGVAGLEIFFVDSMSIDLNAEIFESTSVYGGINIRF